MPVDGGDGCSMLSAEVVGTRVDSATLTVQLRVGLSDEDGRNVLFRADALRRWKQVHILQCESAKADAAKPAYVDGVRISGMRMLELHADLKLVSMMPDDEAAELKEWRDVLIVPLPPDAG